MAEFPDLGKHCNYSHCNMLDFLPMRCDACTSIFCSKHIMYDTHQCQSSYKKNVQVPVCPLCNRPVPTAKGESADVKVSEHIDNDCQSDPAKEKRNRAYKNLCSLKQCKKRELVPILCRDCRRNFCVKHRHADDHQCNGRHNNPAFRPLPAQPSNDSFGRRSSSTANDEALARALQEKLNTGRGALSREELDRQLAEQMQREEYQRQQHGHVRQAGQGGDRCAIN